jgi:hypothetical protein
MKTFQQWLENEAPLIINDNEPEPGFMAGWRIQNNDEINKTTGYTATEGEGYYIFVNPIAAKMMKQHSRWSGVIRRVQFKKPQKLLKADTMPILWAWQHKSDMLFEPISSEDSLWTKINKIALKQTKTTRKNLSENIDILIKELTKQILATGADAVLVEKFAFVVLL